MASLHLVTPTVDRETVETLHRLLKEAQAGRIVGFAYVALHCGPDYSGDVVGHATAHPLFTLGVARALEDLVAHHPRKP